MRTARSIPRTGVLGVSLALLFAVPAQAFDCYVAKKPPEAGAVGVVDFNTGEFAPLKANPGTFERPHGGFFALTDGVNTASTFANPPAHSDGVLPPVLPGGPQHNCDGEGLDSLEVCFGE